MPLRKKLFGCCAHTLPRLVERLLQPPDVGRLEAPQKIPGCGRVRYPLGRKTVGVAGIVPQPVDVFQARAASHHVVGDVEDVVGFKVRHVRLQQRDVLIDRVVQPQPRHQGVHGADASKANRPAPPGHLVVQVAGLKHRLGLVAVVLALEPRRQFSLASGQDGVVCFLHSKRAPLRVL